ncbi:hypothetical protein PFICI_09345 [Pestalotiopsis fici W106-1]|uniref:Uncharacterized protein n=1 Tax=Pestalotiopsis fici (strain W106-1 / CGMCC3.15140) TaxID=1229662 RepID=W3X280_PESFW|nr:uncharacterized protein PFICI_09345 [Pestalotiopsis fici W106-1]ETS79492.1 hypothetical protein PFICI_09345 [Pestalotiopsis fici W106-1]
MGNQQKEDFTAEEYAKFKQRKRDDKHRMDYIAHLNNEGRSDKEDQMIEKWERENEQKKLNKNNKWMVLSPVNKTPQYPTEAQFDTGAVLNYITEDMVRSLGLKKELLAPPRKIDTAVGPGGECKYHVFANWKGLEGCGGRVEFFVLPETSPITKPLIGTKDQKFWDELLDERPDNPLYWTTLSKQKAPEKIESAALRTAALNERTQLQLRKEAHEEKRGYSSSKSKGSRSNEKKTTKN